MKFSIDPAAVLAAALVLTASGAFAQDAQFKKFFGKTVSFKLGACAPDEKDCGPTMAKAIRFDKNGTLTEAFMCGDRTERKHVFGRLNRIKMDGSSGKEKSLNLSGSGNSIAIKSWLKLVFSDGESHEKTDAFVFSTDDGASCTMTGSREMIDKPGGKLKVLPIVSADCRIE